MKKNIISTLLILTMLCSFASLVTAQESSDSATPETTPTIETAQAVDVINTAELIPYRDGDVPAQSAVVDSITPPVSALIMSMMEQDLAYDQSDDTFYWNGLYYMLSLYGQMDSRAELTDDTLILPAEAVADYAAALFSNFNGVPQLPDTMADRITYEDGHYYLSRGDAGLTETQLVTADTLSDGSLLVTGSVVYTVDGSTLCDFTVKLQPNNSMFGYAICDALV